MMDNMKKRLICTLFFIFIISILMTSNSFALDYFLDRTNFPPQESRLHVHTITFNGTLRVIIPNGFSLYSNPNGGIINQGNITWISPNITTISYTLASPNNCLYDGLIYYSDIFHNNNLIDYFTYVCISDLLIVDHKIEYGHGDANYLSENYISDETATIFNLIRIWNLGHYLTPNQVARNVTISCLFEDYPISTYGHGEVEHLQNPNRKRMNFRWTSIESGYWFRIGILSQRVFGKSVGDTYDVSCTELRYNFSNQQVIAEFQDYDLRVRSTQPFLVSTKSFKNNQIEYTLFNNEEYRICDVYFDRIYGSQIITEYYPELYPGESIKFLADNDPSKNVTIFFTPSWFCNSRNPQIYRQVVEYNLASNIPPKLNDIGNLTAMVDIPFVYYLQALDPDDNILTFISDNPIMNITTLGKVGIVNHTYQNNSVGNYTINISVFDSMNESDFELINLEIVPFNNPPVILNNTNTSVIIKNITIYETDLVELFVSIDDYEGDMLNIKWFLNNPGLIENYNITYPYSMIYFNYTFSEGMSGDYNLTVLVSDKYNSDSYTWDVKVLPKTTTTTTTSSSVGGGGSSTRPTTIVHDCISDWHCNDWTPCINNWRRRTCDDMNRCLVETNKPHFVESCEVEVEISPSIDIESATNISDEEPLIYIESEKPFFMRYLNILPWLLISLLLLLLLLLLLFQKVPVKQR
jgi:hypothetical protein